MKRGPLLASFVSLALAAVIIAGPARAEDADQAAATELFNAGRDAMRVGDFAAACPKLAESARLQPTVGALAKLAECEEHEKRLVSAYGRWQQALNLARTQGDERAADVQKEVARLDAALPKLRIVATGTLPPETVIRLDAVELGLAGLGVPLAVEPGRHALQATAPHKLPWSTALDAPADGATIAVTVPVLLDAPAGDEPPGPRALPAPGPPSEARSSPWRIVGVTGGSVGLVALGAGTALGILAWRQRDNAACAATVCPSDSSADALRTAKSSATAATVLFVAGGALLAGGFAAWWLSAPSPAARSGLRLTPEGALAF